MVTIVLQYKAENEMEDFLFNPSASQFVLVFNHFLLVQKYITFIETLKNGCKNSM